MLFKFFHDLTDGYFVDIGAYDPISFSNTLYLYTKGWNGINMEASNSRYHNFLALRPEDQNLNYAIAKNLSYVTLYDVPGS